MHWGVKTSTLGLSGRCTKLKKAKQSLLISESISHTLCFAICDPLPPAQEAKPTFHISISMAAFAEEMGKTPRDLAPRHSIADTIPLGLPGCHCTSTDTESSYCPCMALMNLRWRQTGLEFALLLLSAKHFTKLVVARCKGVIFLELLWQLQL